MKKQIKEESVVSKDEVESWKSEEMSRLETCLSQADEYQPPRDYFLSSRWSQMQVACPNSISTWDTGIDTDLVRFIAATSVKVPQDFVSYIRILCVF